MRMRIGAAVVALTVAVAVWPLAEPAAAAPSITWHPCEGHADVDCGTVTVPLDWTDPGGAETMVALARRKATDRPARLGSLLFDPGGPGDSGVDLVVGRPDLITPGIRENYDVVGLDPRGVGASQPINCDEDVLNQSFPIVPQNPAELQQLRVYNQRVGRNCQAMSGPLTDHVDTTAVARDMEVIRAALGDPKLNYFGLSYGTLMGQRYAELFPRRVGRMVLDSNMDHSITTTAQFIASESATVEDSFAEFARWCGRTNACSLHGRDVGAVFDELYARTERGELVVPGTNPPVSISPHDLVGIVYGAFYGPEWSELAQLLEALRTTAPAAVAARYGSAAPNAFQAVFCSDWRLPVRDFGELVALRRMAAGIAPHMRVSPLAWDAIMACLGWPGPVNNPQHRLRVDPVVPPILMINAVHDPATPYSWAQAVHQQLSNSVLLTYEGWGHVAYWKSRCVSAAADLYLITGQLPSANARCPAVEPSSAPGARATQQAGPDRPTGPSRTVPGWR